MASLGRFNLVATLLPRRDAGHPPAVDIGLPHPELDVSPQSPKEIEGTVGQSAQE